MSSALGKSERRIADISPELRPGYWWPDFVPALDYLPDALAPWRAEARKTFDDMTEFWSVFFDRIVARVKKGDAPNSFLKSFLESPEVEGFSINDRRVVMSEILSAGSETTATALQWFFKAAVLYPDFVKTAQAELDRVIGAERMPGWEDRSNLPYLAAIVEELHRWSSVAAVGVFHATSEEDTYREKTVPAGTTVIINLHTIHHTDEYYRHHEQFIPERFLDSKDPRHAAGLVHAPMHYAFGVGRRECPGKHVADASLFIVISRLLWTFKIELGNNPPPSEEIRKYLLSC